MTDIVTLPTPTYDLVVDVQRAQAMTKQLDKMMKSAMVRNSDYGLIPGTGNKPVLLKPGAEKLLRWYGFSSEYPEDRMTIVDTDDKFTARVTCVITHMRTGYVVAHGIGYASSRENKYRYKSGEWKSAAEVANTVLKIASKRAMVDGTLRACCASGLFTQDLDDSDEREETSQPHNRTEPQSDNHPKATNGTGTSISGINRQRALAERTYRELVDKADALEIPAAMYDPAWPDVELLSKGKALRAAIAEKEAAIPVSRETKVEDDF